jgi:hypothetical protein
MENEKINNEIHKEDIEGILRFNNDISIIKIEEFLEYLEDSEMLNSRGKLMRTCLWKKFIKKD